MRIAAHSSELVTGMIGVHGRVSGFVTVNVLAQMLNVLEQFPLRDQGRQSPATLHLLIETMKRAYRDRAAHVGDADFVEIPRHLINVAASAGNITITLDNSSTYSVANIATAIGNHADYNASVTTSNGNGNFVAGTDTDPTGTLSGGITQVTANDVITIAADQSGTAYNGTINVVASNTATTGSIAATFASGVLTITLDDSTTERSRRA